MSIRTRLSAQELDEIAPFHPDERKQVEEWTRYLLYGLRPNGIGELPPGEVRLFLDRMDRLHGEDPLRPKLPSDVEERIHVLEWEWGDTPDDYELLRLMASLRDRETGIPEFRRDTEGAYLLLFKRAYLGAPSSFRSVEFRTPVDIPCDQWYGMEVPQYDQLSNLSLVMILRAALLPTLVMTQKAMDINGGIPPGILPFKIQRTHVKNRRNLEYYIDPQYIQGLDLERLIDAQRGRNIGKGDPMLATGGSAVLAYLIMTDDGRNNDFGSWNSFFLIGTYEGAIRLARACPDMHIYMLSMDRIMNKRAYILPGLGDAGDRLNGSDEPGETRTLTDLIRGYGPGIIHRYADAIQALYATMRQEPPKDFQQIWDY